MSNLLLVSTFLALTYPAYAIIQTIRKQERPGPLGILLACVSLATPMIALAMDILDSTSQDGLTIVLLANMVVVLVISGIIMVVDYRKPERDLGQSFGTLGLGISLLLLTGLFTTPLILAQFPTASPVSAADFDANANRDIVQASFNRPEQSETNSQPTAAQGRSPAPSLDNSTLQATLQSATGLTSDELLTALTAGSTLADLITANGGDVDAVTAALTETFDAAIAAGSIPAQMLERLGRDGATIASGALSGQIPALFLSSLLGGTQAGPPQGSDGPRAAAQPTSALTTTPIVEPTMVTLPTTVESTKLPTPTPFQFDMEPTATPIPAEPTTVPTCELIVQFNLNLRTGPNEDAEWLLTIPAYTTVDSTGHNDTGWWQVSYDDQIGWVNGDYLTVDRNCTSLPVIE